jgi:hypothetical protein
MEITEIDFKERECDGVDWIHLDHGTRQFNAWFYEKNSYLTDRANTSSTKGFCSVE